MIAWTGPAFFAYVVLVGLTILYAILDPGLLSTSQIAEVFNQSLRLMLVAAGEAAVILGGGIDLSVGGIVTLGNVVAAVLMPSNGMLVGILVTLVVGLLAGLANGAFSLFFDVPPIIVTLASGSLFGGLALAILPQPGGGAPTAFADIATGQLGPFPNALIVVIVLIGLWSVFIRHPLGRALKAAGSHRLAAAMTGRPWRAAALISYGISGLLSAASGLAILGETQTGDPTVGSVYTLLALAAVVLGGVRLSGGFGEIGGPLAGALILSIVVNVLFFMNVSVYYQYVAEGVIVLIPMLGAVLQTRRSSSIGEAG